MINTVDDNRTEMFPASLNTRTESIPKEVVLQFMDAFQVAPGQKMEFRPQLPDGDFSTSTFSSQVQDIVSENEFQILPLADNADNWMGRVLLATVVYEKKAYEGLVRVEKVTSEGNLRFFDLIIVENFREQQRRDFYRLNIRLGIEIEGYGTFKTYDISGGGLAFLSDKEFMKDEALAISLHLKDDIFELHGVVVRCARYSTEKFLISVYFKDIREKAQDEIANYLHKQQIFMISKGIL